MLLAFYLLRVFCVFPGSGKPHRLVYALMAKANARSNGLGRSILGPIYQNASSKTVPEEEPKITTPEIYVPTPEPYNPTNESIYEELKDGKEVVCLTTLF